MKNPFGHSGSKANNGNRQADLDFLLSFLNTKEEPQGNRLYEKGLQDIFTNTSAIHPDGKKKMMAIDLSLVTDTLRNHLKTRFETLVEKSKRMWEESLWEIDGALKWSVDPYSKKIGVQFQLRKMGTGKETATLKSVLDLRLIEIIQGMGLRLDRFRKCPRCGAYFYQKTGKTKTFCSVRCGNAVRVKKFREKRRDE